MRSNLYKRASRKRGASSADTEIPIQDTEFFDSLCTQTGGWLEGALAQAGLPEPGDDTPDAPTNRSEAAALIAAHWLTAGTLEEAYASLSEVEKAVLRAATTDVRVARGTMLRFAGDRGHTPGEAERAITALERRALLLPLGTGPSSRAFKIPKEIRQRLKNILDGAQSSVAIEKPPACDTHTHDSAFVDDFTTLLAFLRRGAYRVTRAGGVHAADLRRISGQLTVPELPPKERNERLIPTRLGLMMELAESLHLIRCETDNLHTDARRMAKWLARDTVSVHRDLVRAACRHEWSYTAEVNAIASFLRDRKVGTWFHIQDVAEAVENRSDFLGMRPDDLCERLSCAATYMCWLGIASVAPDEQEPSLISCTKLGQRLLSDKEEKSSEPIEGAAFMVLPNFEIMIPSVVDLATRWMLESFADPVNRKARGPMRTYRLERAALLSAMKSGLTVDGVIEFLEAHSASLPENVELTLRQWSEAYGEYYFMNPTLLICKDAAAAADARSNPRVAERVLGMLTPEILILEGDSVDHVRGALELAGTMPRPGVKALPVGGPKGDIDAKTRKRHREALRRRASSEKGCDMEGCTRSHTARGLCATHYQQARRGKIDFPE